MARRRQQRQRQLPPEITAPPGVPAAIIDFAHCTIRPHPDAPRL